ncbi:hypothetical protein ACWIUD_04860 [Helicobacter sp. 23-1044]
MESLAMTEGMDCHEVALKRAILATFRDFSRLLAKKRGDSQNLLYFLATSRQKRGDSQNLLCFLATLFFCYFNFSLF